MKKNRLALIGCGFLNEIVATAVENGLLPAYELVAVLGRSEEKAHAFGARFHCKVCTDIHQLMDMKPDFTAEAASVSAVRAYGAAVLNGGSNLVVLSIGAFADSDFYQELGQMAVQAQRRVYIASGAVGGFDVLRTAALMSPITTSICSRKAPASLTHSPLRFDGMLELTEPKRVFSGTAKEAIAILPGHVNVAVATALASAGPENTQLAIDIIPNFVGDEFQIVMEGEEVRTKLSIYSRTSAIAGWSVVAALQNAVSPIVF